MPAYHPAVQTLLLSGLAIFWLIPFTSWLMLKGQGDRLATIWFTGTGVYSIVVTLFVFTPLLPGWVIGPLAGACVLSSVLILYEALRQEMSQSPTPWQFYGGIVVSLLAYLTWTFVNDQYDSSGRSLLYVSVALAEVFLIAKANQVRKRYRSQSMWVLIATFVLFSTANLARLLEFWTVGRYPLLLEFSPVGSYVLTLNYLSVIFYCYGYWGFVVEKNRQKLTSAIEQATLAREREKIATERETMVQETLRERTELMSRLANVGKYAQSGALSASISHELNQPLAAIQLNIQESAHLAQEAQASPRLLALLERINQDNQRAALIVRRVRDMFRRAPSPEKGRFLDPLVQWLLNWMSKRFESEQIQLTVALNAPEPIQFAPGEIEHILMNLIDNAVEALQHLPPSDRHLAISTWQEPGWTCLSVSDNGPGVPKSLKEHLFEISETSKADGLGLGLWLSRYLAERNGGQLQLQAHRDYASCFVLRLPLV